MTHPKWNRVAELFDAVVDLPPDEQDARIAAIDGDEALRREVRDLLEAARASGGGGFIAHAIAATAAELSTGGTRVGQRIGPYRLTSELGHGGMGAVYLAEREDAAYRSTVAIKFILGALASPDAVRRFRAERQILADLTHPNIARLLDGGTADDGTPYLVMEHVNGEPIDTYCARHALEVRDRVRLIVSVCGAVQAAHAALVVHRDLKPENILVTAAGVPKLLDFGIAKLVESGDETSGKATTTALRLTPSYASPEQIRGERVTVATDVFSLGVVLYELLTGRLPVDPQGSPSRTELERRICEEDPPLPSTVVRESAKRRDLAGDLDTIVGKALRKEPAERYQSAADLADDLRRFLDARPVAARRPTVRYRIGKFVRRRTAGVLGTAAAVVLIVVLTVYYMIGLTRERDFAQAERRKSEQVAGFLERLFRVSDPAEARGEMITAREVVDSAVARLPEDLAGQPDVQAAMLYTLGGVYNNLGLSSEAMPLLERGLALRRGDPATGSPTVGDFLARVGEVLHEVGLFDSAMTILTEAVERLEVEYPDENRAVLARVQLANVHRRAGRLIEADSTLRGALVEARTMPQDSALDVALTALSALYVVRGEGAEGEPIAREALERLRSRLGADAPAALSALNNLGQSLYQQTRYAEAEPIMREVLERYQRVFGDKHARTATAWNNLAALYHAQGRRAEAVDAGRAALETYRTVYSERHQRVTLAMTNLASMVLAAGDPEEAERLHRDALRIKLDMLAPGHIDIAVSYNNLAHLFEETGRYAEAERAYRRALQVIEQGRGSHNEVGSIFLANLGGVLEEQDRLPEAEATLRQALAIQRNVLPTDHARTATTLTSLGGLLVRVDRAAEAEPLLREALRMRTTLLSSDHWEIQVTRSALGVCAAALGRDAEAEELLTTSARALREHFGPEDRRARTATERAASFYEERGDTARAEGLRDLLTRPESQRR